MDTINAILQFSEQINVPVESVLHVYSFFYFLYVLLDTAVFAATLYGLHRFISWFCSKPRRFTPGHK